MLAHLIEFEVKPHEGGKVITFHLKPSAAGRMALGYFSISGGIEKRTAQALGEALVRAGVEIQAMSREG